MTGAIERLREAFQETESGLSADGIPWVRLAVGDTVAALRLLRDNLGYERFVDLTAVDSPERPDRFELNYLVYSMQARVWLRLKARTDGAAPSAVSVYPGIAWYEREVYDLFGVAFVDHPNLRRIMLPDNWVGHPLRRDAPESSEPVEFSKQHQEQYGD